MGFGLLGSTLILVDHFQIAEFFWPIYDRSKGIMMANQWIFFIIMDRGFVCFVCPFFS